MPTRTDQTVFVRGLTELRRELNKLSSESYFLGELKPAHYEVATDVVEAARARASSVGRQAARAAESLAAGRGASGAVVRLGARKPGVFALGAEFGSVQYSQFKPWRGSGSEAGYFLYPAIRSTRERVIASYDDHVRRITAAAFPE